jgi:hypothetical protein
MANIATRSPWSKFEYRERLSEEHVIARSVRSATAQIAADTPPTRGDPLGAPGHATPPYDHGSNARGNHCERQVRRSVRGQARAVAAILWAKTELLTARIAASPELFFVRHAITIGLRVLG